MTPEQWQEVKELLAGALERTPQERAGYLEQACAEPSLRREVESLILAHEQTQTTILDRPAGQPKGLAIGSTLGLYEILAHIGAGGMGEVYQARDTKLGRSVAIKILPSAFTDDPEKVARFRREARLLASLNHPNIATIHGLEESGGRHYLVMELIPGQTLAERLSAGPLDTAEALGVSRQIVEALETAHEQGVIHRDLKPANVKVTPDGRVKVLDFGLAKALAGEQGVDLSQAPTLTAAETDEGTLLGTPAYMSPEQVRGKTVDKRTDIWAFGCVLYELLTARRAFRGETLPDTIAAVLGREPEWQALPIATPPRVQELLRRCLQKDVQRRLRDFGDARHELEETPEAPTAAGSADRADTDSRRAPITTTIGTGRAASSVGPPVAALAGEAIPGRTEGRSYKPVALGIAALIVVAAVAAGGYFYFHRTPMLTEKDSIVLADFANATGDPVFDGTLRQGLSVQLEQTPYLQLVSDQQVGETLRLMEKPPDTRLTPAVAREVCQRANATTEIEGSIATLGNQYVLGLNAVNCSSGETLAAQQVTADGKEKVLAALTTAASELRSKLGESRVSLEKFDAPLDRVTTPSLEALQDWTRANQAISNGDLGSAASSLQRAVSLDPNFAVAYSTLGVVYSGLGDQTLSIETTRKGYELRDRASDREKFSIESYYDVFAMGNLEKGTEVAEQWAKLFPRDLSALSALNAAYYWSGRFDEALTTEREMVRIEPTASAYAALAGSYASLGRFDEAKAAIREAEARHFDSSIYRPTLYSIAFVQNDQETMAQQSAGPWPGPYSKPVIQFYTAAYLGRLSQARDLERGAISSATQRGERGFIPSMAATFAVVEALEGNFVQAKNDIRNAGDLSTNPNFDVVGEAAMVAALSGDTAQAQKLADDLNKRFPEATIVQFAYLPAVRGLLAARRGNQQEAAEDLYPLSSHERVIPLDWVGPFMTPVYLRGETHLALHQGARAAADFQMLIDNAGFIVNCPVGALAHLGLGRAYALQGDTPKAKAAYQDFLTLWKDADPDVPVLIAAKAEYAKLQ